MLGVPTQPDHVYNTKTFAVIESNGITQYASRSHVDETIDFRDQFSLNRTF